MTQGTTPTFTLTFPDEIDFTIVDDIIVTFSDAKMEVLLEKNKDEITVEPHVLEVYLSQEETLAMPITTIYVQVNWTYRVDGEVKRACSNIVKFRMCKNLHEEVME